MRVCGWYFICIGIRAESIAVIMDIKENTVLHQNSAYPTNPCFFGYGKVNCKEKYTNNPLSTY